MKKPILLSICFMLLLFIAYSQIEKRLEKQLTLEALDEVVIKSGKSSITLKKDGSIIIKGKEINIEGTDKVNVKASGNLILRGSKIKEN